MSNLPRLADPEPDDSAHGHRGAPDADPSGLAPGSGPGAAGLRLLKTGQAPAPARTPAIAGLTPRPVVLVVDSDPDSAQELAQAAAQHGFETEISTRLSGLAERATQLRPAAIVLEMSFPEGSLAGADAIAEVQERHGCPVVFVSARRDIDTRLEAARAGAHGYLTKPVRTTGLVDLLRMLTQQDAEGIRTLQREFAREVADLSRKLLGEVCVEHGWATPAQIEEVLALQSQLSPTPLLGDLLVSRGVISLTQKLEALALARGQRTGAERNAIAGDVCVERGWITRQQLDDARGRTRRAGSAGENALDTLLAEGLISPKQKAEAQGVAWGIPFVDLSQVELDAGLMQQLLRQVKPATCRRLGVLPFQRTPRRVRVAMRNPLDVFAQDEIKGLLGPSALVDVAIAAEEDVAVAIDRAEHATLADTMRVLDQIMAEGENEAEVPPDDPRLEALDVEALRDLGGHAPVIAICNGLVLRAVQAHASDIHLQPTSDGILMRLRIDGVLHDSLHVPRCYQAAVVSRIKLMADLDIANRLVPQDGRSRIVIQGKPYDLRVSSLPSVFGEEIVIRILDKSSAQVGLDRLGFSTDTHGRLEELVSATCGLILVTGPTGCGKSTTLYSMLHRMNTRDRKIVTVEDPVEYQLPGLTQVQASPASGLTFAAALKSFLRQDPDTIMVGEIRDLEVGSIAVEAALTGHLVLSTLHTNDAPSAITRLGEMGIERFLISSTLIGVLAQRLVRRVCSKCREAYEPGAGVLRAMGPALGADEAPVFYRGRGCNSCRNTGYHGRLGIFELLTMSDALRELINSGAPAYQVRAAAREKGMATLHEDGMRKVRMGLTTIDEVMRVLSSM